MLPLKSGKKNDIVHRLKQIQPETILFLSQLKGLSVHIADALLKIDRMQNSACAPVVDLLTQGDEQTKNRYWLHVDTVTVPNDIKEEKRENITSREVTIAFPLENNSRAGIIYAFLPTEVDSGLPFLINADFILTANRESIQSDKRWNIWLRDELADIVVQGLVELSKRQEYRKSLCGFIPLADEIKSLKDYFEPVCMEVCSRLSDMSIILSDKDELIMPSDARLASKNIRKIFCGDSRAVAFDDFKFVHAELEKYGKQLKAVGVKQFSDDDIRECLSDEQWLSTRDSHWYVDLYDFLSHKKLNDLENLLIILKQGGGLASPSQKTYFPADHSLVMTLNERLSTTGLPKPIFIDEQLHELLSNKQELSDWVKRELKVTDFNISRYVGNTLVPWLYESVAEITGESLLEAVQFILEYWQDITKEDKEIIGKTIPLLLDGGSVTRPDDLQGFELLTPRNHDKDTGWQLVLTTKKDCDHEYVLSDDYINLNEKYIDAFLEAVNAQRYPALENHCISMYKPLQNYDEYIAEMLKSMVGRGWTGREPEITTWLTPSFFHNPAQRENKKNRIALLYWLEWMLRNRHDSLRYGKITWFYYAQNLRKVDSGLYFYLTKIPWIYSSMGLKKPGIIFKKTDPIYEMFGDKLAYLKDDISDDLCKFLGIKTEITIEAILEYLQALPEQCEVNEVNIDLIIKLYKYLDGCGDKDKVGDHFREAASIYIPKSKNRWYKSDEVVWEDNSHVLGDLYGWLPPIYKKNNLRQFFLEKIEISQNVQRKELADAWLWLQEEKDLPTEHIKTSLGKIYPSLLKDASSDDHPDWWEGFVDQAMIWTQKDEFVNKDDVYIADDGNIANLFEMDVNFVWNPEGRNFRDVYDALGIAPLSKSVKVSLEDTGKAEETELPIFLTDYSKRLLCYMVYNESKKTHEQLYEQLRDSGRFGELLQSIETKTDSLTIRYSIAGYFATKQYNAFWDSRRLYFCSGVNEDDLFDDVTEAIARMLWGKDYKKHEDHVRLVLAIKDKYRFEKIINKKDWILPPEIDKETRKDIDSLNNQTHQPQLDNTNEPSIECGISDNNMDDESNSGTYSGTHEDADNLLSTTTQPDSVNSGSAGETGSGELPSGTYEKEMSTPCDNTRKNRFGGYSQDVTSPARQPQNRMISYVSGEPTDDESDKETNKQAQEQRRELGKQAEIAVMEDLEAKGYKVERMPDLNPGYDLCVTNLESSETRYVEVKSVSDDWADRGVGLTRSQHEFGRGKADSFYLAVIENVQASASNRKIYYIQDPVNTITRYQFDGSWKEFSTEIRPVNFRSKHEKNVVE